MQVRRASLILVVFGLITLLIIGAVNLASQKDPEEPASAPPATEQVDNEATVSTSENLKVQEEPDANGEVAASTDNLPRTGAEDFLAPFILVGLLLAMSAYTRSRQAVRRSLLG